MEDKKMTFYGWIVKKHLKTMAPVGDLARDMKDDDTFPRRAGYEKIRSYLEWDCKACSDCLDAFEKAWAEYERERG